MMPAILLCFVISFFVVLLLTSYLIRYLRRTGLCVKDQNKENLPLVPISGGMAVLTGIFVGFMCYVFIQTFFYGSNSYLLEIFAATISISIITFVGFMDDIIIKKSQYESGGLKQWQKPILTLSAAIPLLVINSGVAEMVVPFLGKVNFGLFYPLLLIPVGVVGAANMVNMLGGFNGLETGMGLVYTGMLGAYAYVNHRPVAALIALLTFGALLAFFKYNKFPAKILPGDSLTYLLGAVLVSIAILGNLEKAAVIVSIPFFVEFILKLRGKFKKKTIGYCKDGKLFSKYNKIYSLPHIFTRTGRYTEKQVVFFIVLIELFFSSLIWFV